MNKTLLWVIAIIVVGAGAFYGGMKYQQTKKPVFTARNGAAGGTFLGRTGAGGNNVVSGVILSEDSNSITVQQRTGGNKIVILPGSAQIGKFVTGTTADLSVGQNVMVVGTGNSDGSVTAQDVQIRPAMPSASSTPFGQ